MLQGFLRDCARMTREQGAAQTPLALDPNEPLYIVELGAGSGKFSFFMLKALAEMQEVRRRSPRLLPVCCCPPSSPVSCVV